jgi:ABC-type phosphate transport system substrate-binding protein
MGAVLTTKKAMLLGVGLAFLAPAASPVAAAEKASYRIIVNAANPETTVKREQLSSLFLKNVRRWPDATPVLPVDLSVTSPARAAFSKDVFGQDVVAIQTYWQGEIASGRGSPPPVKSSDREVVSFVDGNPGGIGYVSAGATLSGKVKLLKVTE